MRVITFATQKGGAGKSTLVSALAVAAVERGERVIAFDLDAQRTLAEWGKARSASTLSVAHVPASKSAQIKDLLAAARADYSLAILDTPGADSPATHNAMAAADFCLVPLRPTRPDALGIKPTVEALIRGHKRFGFVLSQCPPGRGTGAAEMAAGLGTLGLLAEPAICSRADFQDAYAAGQGVTEYAPGGKAADEIRRLWAWVDLATRKG